MCRYAFSGPYKNIYACFKCRKAFKQKPNEDLDENQIINRDYRCPQCRSFMNRMGHDFKAPKNNQISQWKTLEILFNHDITFSSCGCGAPGYRPRKLNEVYDFLEKSIKKSNGEILLKKLDNKKTQRNKIKC